MLQVGYHLKISIESSRQAAEIRFSVFKDAYTVSGTLKKISPDRSDEKSDLPYYAGELNEQDLYLLGE